MAGLSPMSNSDDAAGYHQRDRQADAPLVFAWPILLLFGVMAAGCSSQPEPTYPVHGVVRLDGETVTHGNVMFESMVTGDRQSQYSARAVIGPDGAYRLTTFGDEDGAVAGRHRASVYVPDMAAGDVPGPQRLLTPAEYARLETSGLEFEVGRDDNQIDLELSSKE